MQAVAASSQAARGLDPTVKIVGLLMGSLTIVAMAALLVFGGAEPSRVATSGGVDERAADDELAAAARLSREVADEAARTAARVAEREHMLRHEAQRLQAQQAALTAERAAAKAKAKKPRKRRQQANEAKAVEVGSDFDLL